MTVCKLTCAATRGVTKVYICITVKRSIAAYKVTCAASRGVTVCKFKCTVKRSTVTCKSYIEEYDSM